MVQVLRETSTKGNRNNRYDALEVVYGFDAGAGEVINSVTLEVDAITGITTNDELVIAFSTDNGQNWQDDSLGVGRQEYTFESLSQGDDLLVKIYDTSSEPGGNTTNAEIVIDQLFAAADVLSA